MNPHSDYNTEPLPFFLSHRFSPCIHIIISQNLIKSEPKCATRIFRAWEDLVFSIQNNDKRKSDEETKEYSPINQNLIHFRTYFPDGRTDDKSLFISLAKFHYPINTQRPNETNSKPPQSNVSQPSNVPNPVSIVKSSSTSSFRPFYFTNANYSSSATRELPFISFLRYKLFRRIYCRQNDFYDLPQTILIFTASPSDDSYSIPQYQCCSIKRSNSFNFDDSSTYDYNKIPMNNIVYNPKKLKSVLQTFLDHIIKPRFRDSYKRVENEFTQNVVMEHQLDDAIRSSTPLSISAAQSIKQYADYQMMNGEFKVAYSLYHSLIMHFPSEKDFSKYNYQKNNKNSSFIGSLFSFGSSDILSTEEDLNYLDCLRSATFCAVSCDIIIGEINNDTMKCLYFLRDNSPTISYRLIISLIIFWILPRTSKESPDVLFEFIDYLLSLNTLSANQSAVMTSKLTSTSTNSVNRSNSFPYFSTYPSVIQSAFYPFTSISSIQTFFCESPQPNSGLAITFYKMIEPIIKEQIIQFSSNKVLPFEYFLLAQKYKSIYGNENYVRCLWNSFITIKKNEKNNCGFCLSYLLETIINVLLREKNFQNQPKQTENWFLSSDIGYLMRFKNLPRLPIFASFFALWDSASTFFETGFIKASVIRYSTKNPMSNGPRKYKGNWRQLAMRLFGCSKSSSTQFNTFYYSNSLSSSTNEMDESILCDLISIEDEISVTVSIQNCCPDINVGDVWLRIEGNAETKKVEVMNNSKTQIVFKVKPKKTDEITGIITIVGLNIFWVNNINLYTLFQKPLLFKYYEKAPIVQIEQLYAVKEIFAGDATLIKLVLHIGPIPLKTLSLLIDMDQEVQPISFNMNKQQPVRHSSNQTDTDNLSNFVLITPNAKYIGNQYYFGNVEPNQDIEVNILFTTTVSGVHSNWLFFSYNSDLHLTENDSCLSRYSSFHSLITVYNNIRLDRNIAAFPSFFDLDKEEDLEISLKRIDEDHSYQITITNNSKKHTGHVTVEFFERQQSTLINNHCRFMPNNFDLLFGTYLTDQQNRIWDHSLIRNDSFRSTYEHFIIFGFTKKCFESIPGRKSVAFFFKFQSLDSETYPYMQISINNKEYISDLSMILHSFETL